MRNRNDETDFEIAFDYDDWDEEQALKSGKTAEEHENPYEDYDIYDVVVTETVKKKVAVFAKDAKSAQKWVEDTMLDSMDMERDIEEYTRTAKVTDDEGSTSFDETVPLWWYEDNEDD